MRQPENEKGYALIIVLFAIVFITVLTAVFMKGSMNNNVQEKTVDENNLVVVAAEAGVKYYTFELMKAYDEEEFEGYLNEEIHKVQSGKSKSIDYIALQNKMLNKLKENIKDKVNEFKAEGAVGIVEDYQHGFEEPYTTAETRLNNQDIQLVLKGTVKGTLKKGGKNYVKNKKLNFELAYIMPYLAPEESEGEKPEEEIDLHKADHSVSLSQVKQPDKVDEMTSSGTNCTEFVNISGGECTLPFTDANKLRSVSGKAKVYTSANYTDSGGVKVHDAQVRMNSVRGGPWEVTNGILYIHQDSAKWGSTKLTNSLLYIGKAFEESGSFNFQNSQITVREKFTASSGNNVIDNSIMSVGLDFHLPNRSTIQYTHLTVGGMMVLNSGADVAGSFIRIAKYLDAPSKLILRNSELFVGEYLQINTGADIVNSKMIVNAYINTPSPVNIIESAVSIGGNFNISTSSKVTDSTLTVGGTFQSPVLVTFSDSSVIAKNTDLAEMTLSNTNYCTETLKVRNLKMTNSKIYYLSSSNKTNNNVIQLSPEEYSKKCSIGIQNDDREPPLLPDLIDWTQFDPELESVEYYID